MKKLVLFLGTGPRAAQAADAFRKAAGLFASSFDVRAKTFEAVTESELVSAARVIAFDEAVKDKITQSHIWSVNELESRSNQLLAELMGGGAAYVPPPPVPQPKLKSLGTVKVGRETAGRRGKGVTVVSELPLNDEAIKELATRLKTRCGSGGTAKDGRIEIQGDHRDTVTTELEAIGYKVKRSGG